MKSIILIALLSLIHLVLNSELTFELEDRARECFTEEISNQTKAILEFQVVTGGHYDVDVTLKDPEGFFIYDEKKKQYDSHQFTVEKPGAYEICFSNEFSSYSHKTVYFDLQVGDEPPLIPEMGKQHGALTMMESSSVSVHEALKVVIDYQTHHRLREATSRSVAEYLWERVQYYSLGQTILIIVTSLVQVYTLRNFFAEKRDVI